MSHATQETIAQRGPKSAAGRVALEIATLKQLVQSLKSTNRTLVLAGQAQEMRIAQLVDDNLRLRADAGEIGV